MTRLKRAAKELLGHRQWPKQEEPRPLNYEEQIYASVVRPSDVCFDVGANQGDVALFLSRLAGDSGTVVAFEPVWPVYLQLCHNIQWDTYLKAPIITVPAGLADAERNASIQVPNDQFAMGSMARPDDWGKAQVDSEIISYPARFLTLDSFLVSTHLTPPDIMKIDVEGAELLVLRGAVETFSRGARPLILIEIFAPWEQAFGYQPWEPLSWLGERGYRLLFACPNGLIEHTPSLSKPFPSEYEQGYNVLAFVPEQHSDRVEPLKSLKTGGAIRPLPMAPCPRPNKIASHGTLHNR